MQAGTSANRLLGSCYAGPVSHLLLMLLICSLCLVSRESEARTRKPSASLQLSQLLDEITGIGINIAPRPGPTIEDCQTARRLIDTGAGVNTRGKESRVTVLMLAAECGDADFVYYLLSRGARVNVEDRNSGTALERAIFRSSPECVELLLERGASVKKRYNGFIPMTPLMLASYMVDHEDRTAEQCDAVIKSLLRHGADARVVSKHGFTVLLMQLMTMRPRLSAMRLLLEAGADANQAADNGVTPLDQSEAIQAAEVSELLKQWGARRSSSSPSRSDGASHPSPTFAR